MGSKLFVSNLDFELTPDAIREIFAGTGTCVTLTLVTDRETKRSRGFAFVEMSTPEEAQKAIETLHGKVVNGRPISVAEDRGRRAQGGAGAAEGAPAGQGEGDADGGQRGGAPRERGAWQPLQAMQRVFLFRKKKKSDPYMENPNLRIDYRDVKNLARFISERGRILPRRLTGLSAYNQRKVAKAIKRSQELGLMPFVVR